MAYTNSPLISCTKLSPNHSGQRVHEIDRITPHCVVGQLTAENICGCFTSPSRQASCNYAIGTDGRIALCVEEKNRSWCSSSNANDQRAVTIECASDLTDPYAINDAVYASLINLCADICERNGKNKMVWFADKDKTLAYTPNPNEMVITVHRWFANKACPGNWLYARLGDLAAKVNEKLKGNVVNPDPNPKQLTNIMGKAVATVEQMQNYIVSVNPAVARSVIDMTPLYLSEGIAEGVRGDIAFAQSCLETDNFKFTNSAVTLDQNNFCGMGVTSNGAKGNSFSTPQIGIRAQIQHLKAYASTDPLNNVMEDPRFKYVARGCAEYVEWLGQRENPNGRGWATGANYGYNILEIFKAILKMSNKVEGGAEKPSLPYQVRIPYDDLQIRVGPGTNYGKTGKYTGKGVFTIIQESPGQGSAKGWGKLKSGLGWIALDFCEKI